MAENLGSHAFLDPSDPTVVFLSLEKKVVQEEGSIFGTEGGVEMYLKVKWAHPITHSRPLHTPRRIPTRTAPPPAVAPHSLSLCLVHARARVCVTHAGRQTGLIDICARSMADPLTDPAQSQD